MADSTEEPLQSKLIDNAINDCRANIVRHSRASLLELFIVVAIISIFAVTLYKLAELQGVDNDAKRRRLEQQLEESQSRYESERISSERARRTVDELQKKTAEPKADAKLADELAIAKRSLESQLADEKNAAQTYQKVLKDLQGYKSPPVVTDAMLYGSGALFIVLVGVFTGLYRFHLREIAKNEQYKLGLIRIRVAANNASVPGFGGEVRTALTKGAFDSPAEGSFRLRPGKIESPVPGHPSSDLATSLLNRLLEEVEVVLQPKAKGARE